MELDFHSAHNVQHDQDDEIFQEETPSLTEALEMTRKSHLLVSQNFTNSLLF
jgi:hypothetical protein